MDERAINPWTVQLRQLERLGVRVESDLVEELVSAVYEQLSLLGKLLHSQAYLLGFDELPEWMAEVPTALRHSVGFGTPSHDQSTGGQVYQIKCWDTYWIRFCMWHDLAVKVFSPQASSTFVAFMDAVENRGPDEELDRLIDLYSAKKERHILLKAYHLSLMTCEALVLRNPSPLSGAAKLILQFLDRCGAVSLEKLTSLPPEKRPTQSKINAELSGKPNSEASGNTKATIKQLRLQRLIGNGRRHKGCSGYFITPLGRAALGLGPK